MSNTGKKYRCSICGSRDHTKVKHGTGNTIIRRGTHANHKCSVCGELGHHKNWHKQEDVRNLTEKVCDDCNRLLPISEFGKNERQRRNNGEGLVYLWYNNLCKECYYTRYTLGVRSYAAPENIDKVIHTRCAKAGLRSSERNMDFDLTEEFVKGLFDKQDGKCFYSGIPMSVSGSAVMSIDRVDSNLGYTQNNVVLCCGLVNLMKNDTPTPQFIELCGAIWNNK